MSTRNLRIAVLGMAIMILAGAAMAQQPIRIAVIDLDRLVATSVVGRQLSDKLEAFQTQVQAEITTMADKARATQKLINDGANSLSSEKLAELQQQLEDESIEVRRFTEKKQREGAKMRDEGLQQIEDKLQPVLDKIQTDGNYDLILNRTPGVVIMASDRIDITTQVVEAFDAAEAAAAGGGE